MVTARLAVAMMILGLAAPAFSYGQTEEAVIKRVREYTDRQAFDEAMKYLEALRGGRAVSENLLDYELGQVYVLAARDEGSSKVRMALLEKAINAFQRFVKVVPSGDRYDVAITQLADAHVELARLHNTLANKTTESRPDHKKLKDKAREHYGEALEIFEKQRREIRERLSQLSKFIPPNDEPALVVRDKLRAQYLQVRLIIPAVQEERGDTYPPGSQQAKSYLEIAQAEYENIYQSYRTRLAGLYARMYQGRTLTKLGRAADATHCFEGLLQQPDSPGVFRDFKHHVIINAEPLWLGKAGDLERAVELTSQVTFEEGPKADKASLVRARLCRQLAVEIAEQADDARRILSLNKEARRIAARLADKEGPQQKEAQKFLQSLPNPK